MMSPAELITPNPKLKFMDQRGSNAFFAFLPNGRPPLIRRFIVWSGKRHPKEMGEAEVRGFLTHLAAERNVAASTWIEPG